MVTHAKLWSVYSWSREIYPLNNFERLSCCRFYCQSAETNVGERLLSKIIDLDWENSESQTNYHAKMTINPNRTVQDTYSNSQNSSLFDRSIMIRTQSPEGMLTKLKLVKHVEIHLKTYSINYGEDDAIHKIHLSNRIVCTPVGCFLSE